MTNASHANLKKEKFEKNDELLFYMALFIANHYQLLSIG